MNALGKYLLAGTFQAVGIVSCLTALSLLLPPFSHMISGAPISLLTLRKGPAHGARVAFGALLLITLLGQLAGMGLALGIVFALGVWLPVWVCSSLLRTSESQGLMLLAIAAIGAALVLGSYLYSEELALVWQAWRDRFLQQDFSATESVQLEQVFEVVLPLLNGIVAAGMVISLASTVLLARWWQSRLFNPGGFSTEFRQLLLPGWMAVLTAGLMILSAMYTGAYEWQIRNLLIVMVVVHVIQGIASVHRAVSVRNLSPHWLIAMYVFLLFLPQMALFIACLGMVDTWIRRRKGAPDDPGQV